jgi:hypothetical protein
MEKEAIDLRLVVVAELYHSQKILRPWPESGSRTALRENRIQKVADRTIKR